MEGLNLTKAERTLLRKADIYHACGPRGMAANRLIRLGLAEWDDQAGGGLWWLHTTRAGHAFLLAESSANSPSEASAGKDSA